MPHHVNGVVLKVWIGCAVFLLVGAWAGAQAAVSPQAVSKRLVASFVEQTGRRTLSAKIVEKNYVGMKIQTVVFAVGSRTYRVVFSSDHSVGVSLSRKGEPGAQSLWSTRDPNVTIEEIVNVIYSREFGQKYEGSAGSRSSSDVVSDASPTRISRQGTHGEELRWDRLMNQVIRGDLAGLAGAGGGNASKGLSQATSMAKMLSPCSGSGSNSSPQRSAVTDLAMALASASFSGEEPGEGPGKGPDAGEADHSRNYKKRGTYSVSRDLAAHDAATRDQEMFRLIQQSRSDAYEIFRTALAAPDSDAKDPYALAALRNYRTVARELSPEQGKALVDSVLTKTVVDLDAFTRLRKASPNAPVIYDRPSDQFFVDPTLNSPPQARYLLSIAVLYAWNFEHPEIRNLVARYEAADQKVSRIADAVLDDNDLEKLKAARADVDRLSQDLFEVAERLRRAPARPSL